MGKSKQSNRELTLLRQMHAWESMYNRSPTPEIKKRLDETRANWEEAKVERKARAQAARKKQEQVSADQPNPETPSTSSTAPAPPTGREKLVLKAREQYKQAQRLASEARLRSDLHGSLEDITAKERDVEAAAAKLQKAEDHLEQGRRKAREHEEARQRVQAEELAAAEQQAALGKAAQEKAALEKAVQEELVRRQEAEAAAKREAARLATATIEKLQQEQQEADRKYWSEIVQAHHGPESSSWVPANEGAATQISSTVNLDGEGVCNAIAALVIGISNQGLKIGIASDELQQAARTQADHGMPCLVSPIVMVIPLLLFKGLWCGEEDKDGTIRLPSPSEEDDLDPIRIGHWVVVVVQRGDTGIDLQFLNSLSSSPDWSHPPKIRAVARRVIRNSGWIDRSMVQFRYETWPTVQEQTAGNTCGIHAVLNAWASVLKLQLNHMPRSWLGAETFYQDARQLINRAMAGECTAEEIQAWLYSTECVVGSVVSRQQQIAQDPGISTILKARTVRMTDFRLTNYLASESVPSSDPRRSHKVTGDQLVDDNDKADPISVAPSNPPPDSTSQSPPPKRRKV
ncbi:MAG: hypothetical protein Q9225_005858 [Loekoesia sp. 1 TL-2023]